MKCPQCNRELDPAQEPRWRPFCSRKCKLVDFGHWLDELGLNDAPAAEPGERDDPSGAARLQ